MRVKKHVQEKNSVCVHETLTKEQIQHRLEQDSCIYKTCPSLRLLNMVYYYSSQAIIFSIKRHSNTKGPPIAPKANSPKIL